MRAAAHADGRRPPSSSRVELPAKGLPVKLVQLLHRPQQAQEPDHIAPGSPTFT